jgi:hypothetical protein
MDDVALNQEHRHGDQSNDRQEGRQPEEDDGRAKREALSNSLRPAE